MISIKRVVVILSFISLFFLSSEELSVNIFFNAKDIERVIAGDIISRMYIKYDAVKENTDKFITVPKTEFADENFSQYEVVIDEKAFIPYKMGSDSKKLSFYNTLVAFSKLKGATYYSRLRGAVELLIENSYTISSPTDRKRIPDPIYSSVQQRVINYFVQKDNKFGNLAFKSELINQGNNFILINTTVDRVAKALVEVCRAGEYKIITYFIYDNNREGFFYYTVSLMRIHNEVFLKGNNLIPPLYPTLFSNRLRGATVHLAKLLGLDWSSKINPWDEKFLKELRRSKKEG